MSEPQLGNLTQLNSLILDDNQLSGEFPTSITNLVKLSYFTFDCWITSTDPAVITFIDNITPGWQNSTCPVVNSITRSNLNPTNSPNVNFTVTFTESVTGVDPVDFALTTTGLTDASITSVTGSGSIYTVTANTGTGNGTLRLDVSDNDSITNTALNPLGGTGASNGNFTGGEMYTITDVFTLFLPLMMR